MKPDVLALKLEEAIARCRSAGWQVEIVHTRPPAGEPAGAFRVVRFDVIGDYRGVLVAAREALKEADF